MSFPFPTLPRERQLRLGLALLLGVLLFALAGPVLAPHAQDALVGQPYGPPSGTVWLGYDYLGRDVVSRLLHGGWTVLWMSLASALAALVVGAAIGILAGFAGRRTDQAIVWGTDVLLAFPDLILVLLVVSMLGREPGLIVLTVAIAFVPGVVRLARGVTMGVARLEFVEAARLLGYPAPRILFREILPNIATPLLVHFGIMLTWAISMLAGLSFLGYGVAPPAADWGLMINENRAGLVLQPWAALAPVVLIGLFALGANLVAEGVSRLNARIGAATGGKTNAG